MTKNCFVGWGLNDNCVVPAGVPLVDDEQRHDPVELDARAMGGEHVCGRITVIALLLWLCVAGQAQQEAAPKEGALGAVGLGWTYLWADQGAGERVSLNGWFVRPSLNVGNGYSVFADFTNYYGANKRGSVNSHGFTFGVGKQFFRKSRVRPSLFAEAGNVRASNAGRIVNQFVFATGASLSVPFWRDVSLIVTPAEWVFLYPNGDPRNDYNAKVGVSIPFGKR